MDRTANVDTAVALQQQLEAVGDREKARASRRFFKAEPGGYGEGDRFRGIPVPVLRRLARQYRGLPLDAMRGLLQSAYHEDRLTGLLIMVQAYPRGDETLRQALYELYLGHSAQINNWDLVDTSAEHIIGAHLQHRSKAPLTRLARSKAWWERRMALLATFRYIKQGQYDETLRIARLLLHDREDLIHKAVGWMLREVGKRDRGREEAFLRAHYREMPRTALRYAIERLPEGRRQAYLKGEV